MHTVTTHISVTVLTFQSFSCLHYFHNNPSRMYKVLRSSFGRWRKGAMRGLSNSEGSQWVCDTARSGTQVCQLPPLCLFYQNTPPCTLSKNEFNTTIWVKRPAHANSSCRNFVSLCAVRILCHIKWTGKRNRSLCWGSLIYDHEKS